MTKKRRYLISAAVLVACVGIVIGVLAMLPPQPGVTKANFNRIEKGMTLAEVERLFDEEGILEGGGRVSWSDEDFRNVVVIEFADDRVENKGWYPWDETFLNMLRRWLHLPK